MGQSNATSNSSSTDGDIEASSVEDTHDYPALSSFSSRVQVMSEYSTDVEELDVVNSEENIIAYRCDSSFNELDLYSSPSLTQGGYLDICVETERGSEFFVGGFKDVVVTQNDDERIPF